MPSLVEIDPVEENENGESLQKKDGKDGRTDDRRQTIGDQNSSNELKT